MKSGDSFGIGYSTSIKNPGFINFTVGHELGHYFLDGHVVKLFATGSLHASHSGFISDDTCEREADLFAASLLMPEVLFRKATRVAGQGFPAIEFLANKCGTSITATAIRYAEFSEDPVVVIVSSGGMVEYCCLSPAIQELGGITWLKRGDAIPGTTTTGKFQSHAQNILDAAKDEGFSMLDDWIDGTPRIEMKEDVVGLGDYEKILTVLFTEEIVEPEDPDEPEDTFDRWDRRR
jgi:hypothetical protein